MEPIILTVICNTANITSVDISFLKKFVNSLGLSYSSRLIQNELNHYIGIVLAELLVSSYNEMSMCDLLYAVSENGKPYFTNAAGFFNISHSKDIVVVSFSSETPVGVDIEYMDPNFGVDNSLLMVFSKDQRDLIYSMSEGIKNEQFFRVWSLNEAYLKMSGLGLSNIFKGYSILKTDNGFKIFDRLMQSYSFVKQQLIYSNSFILTMCCQNADAIYNNKFIDGHKLVNYLRKN